MALLLAALVVAASTVMASTPGQKGAASWKPIGNSVFSRFTAGAMQAEASGTDELTMMRTYCEECGRVAIARERSVGVARMRCADGPGTHRTESEAKEHWLVHMRHKAEQSHVYAPDDEFDRMWEASRAHLAGWRNRELAGQRWTHSHASPLIRVYAAADYVGKPESTYYVHMFAGRNNAPVDTVSRAKR
jgi:hypothetical protein